MFRLFFALLFVGLLFLPLARADFSGPSGFGQGAVLSAATVGNPHNTTSTSNVMMGLGSTCNLTPKYSSRVHLDIYAIGTNSTLSDGILVVTAYGTGAAPTNTNGTTTATGTTVGSVLGGDEATGGLRIPLTTSVDITGLTPGTFYWFDWQMAVIVGGTASLFNVTCSAHEF